MNDVASSANPFATLAENISRLDLVSKINSKTGFDYLSRAISGRNESEVAVNAARQERL